MDAEKRSQSVVGKKDEIEQGENLILTDNHLRKVNEEDNLESLPVIVSEEEMMKQDKEDEGVDITPPSSHEQLVLQKMNFEITKGSSPKRLHRSKETSYLLKENLPRDFGRGKRAHIKNKKQARDTRAPRTRGHRIRKNKYETNDINNFNMKTVSNKHIRKEAERREN